jgi:hypothetical protein
VPRLCYHPTRLLFSDEKQCSWGHQSPIDYIIMFMSMCKPVMLNLQIRADLVESMISYLERVFPGTRSMCSILPFISSRDDFNLSYGPHQERQFIFRLMGTGSSYQELPSVQQQPSSACWSLSHSMDIVKSGKVNFCLMSLLIMCL